MNTELSLNKEIYYNGQVGRKDLTVLPKYPNLGIVERGIDQALHMTKGELSTALLGPEYRGIETTPSGYYYDNLLKSSHDMLQPGDTALFITAHDTDATDMTGGMIGTLNSLGIINHELIQANGEKGTDPISDNYLQLPHEFVSRLRRQEGARSTKIQPRDIELAYGVGLPDWYLLQNIENGTDAITEKIIASAKSNKKFIIISQPLNDIHPDHISVGFMTFLALVNLKNHWQRTGKKPPAWYIMDSEFGRYVDIESQLHFPFINSYQKKTISEVDRKLRKIIFGDFDSDFSLIGHPFMTHKYIFTMPHLMMTEKMLALHENYSQMVSSKGYADMLPKLGRLRYIQAHGEDTEGFGEAFSQIIIPGITGTENPLVDTLPEGCISVLKKTKN